MYCCLCIISVLNVARKLNRILSIGEVNLILKLIIKSRLINEISSLAIVSFLAVGFSTVYGIVICNPLATSIWCIV